jgi:hypothetical protein
MRVALREAASCQEAADAVFKGSRTAVTAPVGHTQPHKATRSLWLEKRLEFEDNINRCWSRISACSSLVSLSIEAKK